MRLNEVRARRVGGARPLGTPPPEGARMARPLDLRAAKGSLDLSLFALRPRKGEVKKFASAAF
jgi:hypothetical protein